MPPAISKIASTLLLPQYTIKDRSRAQKVSNCTMATHNHMLPKSFKKYLDAGVGILRHPPCSPDLVPNDFCLFDLIKQHLTDAVDEKYIESQITEALEKWPISRI